MKSMKRWQRLSCVLSILLLLNLFSAASFAKTYQLTILHTNDHHGHFLKFNPYPVTDVGGLAAQSALVNIVRAEVAEQGGHVLLLSAGDINTGIPESDMLDAEPDFRLMSMIGYDAMTLGNHEFDKPRSVLLKQKEWATFPFLAANIVKKDSGETLFEPYIIKEFDGLKVAIFGLTTEETPILTFPEYTADLKFTSVIETAKTLVPKLREEADIVIALTHLGFFEDSGGGYKSPGDLKLAKDVPGIDVIVGGHSHTELKEAQVVNNTLIVQAGEWSQNVGRLDLKIDTDASEKITETNYRLLPVNMKKRVKYNDKTYYMFVDKGYIEDQEMLDVITPYAEQAEKLLTKPVGEAVNLLVGAKESVRSEETNLANLVTDAMRAKTGAEIALQNGGGIRTDIAPGTITYKDILSIQPFGNTLVVVDMTGQQIMDALAYAATVEAGNGAFLQVSGLKWTNNKGVAENVTVGGKPIDLQKTYKVVTNNFMASGGDGYKMLKDLPQVNTGFVDADAVKEYIQKAGKVDPKVEGRLTIIK